MSYVDGGTELEAFREAQLPRVHAYVAKVCRPERSEEAVAAALLDFFARVQHDPASAPQPDRELLHATRSAAAGRFDVVVPLGRPELALAAECRPMPELLALHANGERADDETLIAAHLAGCAVCAHTLVRMQAAERAFASAAGVLPALEIDATVVDTSRAPARPVLPQSAGDPKPVLEAESSPPAPPDAGLRSLPTTPPSGTRRRRSGGLVGAIRRLGRGTPG